jgi:pimeloyl-ACP methyl ester carboxylesterase
MTAHRTDISFASCSGNLRLHAQIQGPEHAPFTVLCLHGLTRNSADFGSLAALLSARYRVLTADQRGRGKSQRDPHTPNYHPGTYASDMFALLDHLAIDRVAVIGTSMGGIMAMIMGAAQPARLRGLVLNDIGPQVPVASLQRLRSSLNGSTSVTTWSEASLQARRVNEIAFPDYGDANLSAPFHTMHHALPRMAQAGYGRVIDIASVHGLVASVKKSPYVAAKFGLVGLKKGHCVRLRHRTM